MTLQTMIVKNGLIRTNDQYPRSPRHTIRMTKSTSSSFDAPSFKDRSSSFTAKSLCLKNELRGRPLSCRFPPQSRRCRPMPERAASAIPTGLTVRVRGIPMPHLSVLFSLYFNSAAHPRHVMSAFVPLLGHGERRRINHRFDPQSDDAGIAGGAPIRPDLAGLSPVAIRPAASRCFPTWQAHKQLHAARITAYPRRCKSIRINIG